MTAETEWIELKDLQAVAKAQADGWEIEFYYFTDDNWSPWKGVGWQSSWKFRGRPRQPKMKKVKMLCYLVDNHRLNWLVENASTTHGMVRIPAQDIEIEVPDDN